MWEFILMYWVYLCGYGVVIIFKFCLKMFCLWNLCGWLEGLLFWVVYLYMYSDILLIDNNGCVIKGWWVEGDMSIIWKYDVFCWNV